MNAIDKVAATFPFDLFLLFSFSPFVCFLCYIFFYLVPSFFLRFSFLSQSGGMKLLRNSRFIKTIIRLCFVKLVYREIYYSEREKEREIESGSQ